MRAPARIGLGWLGPAAAVALLAGCGAPAQPPPTAAGTPASQPTFGSMAERGEAVFAEQCAACHGDRGQGLVGPALIGEQANLGQYGTGRGLYDFVRQAMPQNAPGSLSPDQYREVVSYVVVRNGLAEREAAFSEGALGGVGLAREPADK